MTLNYLILVHKNPGQFHRLVKKLNAKRVNFFVHVDRTIDSFPFSKPLAGLKNVHFLKKNERLPIAWAGINASKIMFRLLEKVYKKVSSNAYCIHLSGQDYPLQNNAFIFNYLESNYGKNFISIDLVQAIWPQWKERLERYNFHVHGEHLFKGIFPISDPSFFTFQNAKNYISLTLKVGVLKTARTAFKEKRIHPSGIIPMGGSAFWALPAETVKELLKYTDKNPWLLQYHKYTHATDEVVLHSLINHLKKPEDIDKSITYTNWVRKRKDTTGPVTFHTQEDLEELKTLEDHYLFARKFDADLGSFIFDELDKKTAHSKHDLNGE